MIKIRVPQLPQIEFGAAMMAAIGTMTLIDMVAIYGATHGGLSSDVTALFLEVAILAVSTALAAWLHTRRHNWTSAVGLGLVALCWALATMILAPITLAFVSPTLMAGVAVAAAALNRQGSPAVEAIPAA